MSTRTWRFSFYQLPYVETRLLDATPLFSALLMLGYRQFRRSEWLEAKLVVASELERVMEIEGLFRLQLEEQ